ncbi:MAG: hypothetical protein MR861_01935 [Clostridiales bacterium]|nr:hypothetical protein [Clostridiales bacterium]
MSKLFNVTETSLNEVRGNLDKQEDRCIDTIDHILDIEAALQSILTDKFRDENENTCRMVHIALTSVERIENELQEVLEGISDALLPKPEPPKNLYGSIDF